MAPAGFDRTCEVAIFFDRSHRRLEQGVNAETFRLGCTPVVNLFQPEALAVPTAPAEHEYRLQPEHAYPQGYEVYSVEAVTSQDPMAHTTTEYQPITAIRPEPTAAERPPYWYTVRRPAERPHDRGTEVSLCLVDPSFLPRPSHDPVLTVQLTCTNRDLPSELASYGTHLSFELEAAAPLAAIRCVRPVTPTLRPHRPRGGAWRLIAQLNLNYLSLTDSAAGLDALRELLQLYQQFLATAPVSGTAATPTDAPLLEALVGVGHRRVIGRLEDTLGVRFARGLEVTLDFDEGRLHPGAIYLFASVLDHFVAQYVSNNSFSRLVARNRQRELLYRWPLRPGQLATL